MGPVGVAGLVLSAISTVSQFSSNRKAQDQQKKQFEAGQAEAARGRAAEKQLADLQTMRAKRAAVREAQIRRADVESAGESQGVSGSSAIAGATSSIGTQAGNNVSFLDTANQLQSTAATAFGNARDISSRPINVNDTFSKATGFVGGTIFDNRKEISGLFGQ